MTGEEKKIILFVGYFSTNPSPTSIQETPLFRVYLPQSRGCPPEGIVLPQDMARDGRVQLIYLNQRWSHLFQFS